MNNFNDIEEKLNFLAYRIKERAKLNLLDINILRRFIKFGIWMEFS